MIPCLTTRGLTSGNLGCWLEDFRNSTGIGPDIESHPRLFGKEKKGVDVVFWKEFVALRDVEAFVFSGTAAMHSG